MVIITSTFTADVMQAHLNQLLQYFCAQPTHFIYNQVFPQLLLPNSAFKQNREGLNVLIIRLHDLLPYSPKPTLSQVEQFIIEFSSALTSAHTSMHVPLLILFTPAPLYLNATAELDNDIASQIKQRVYELKNMIILSPSDISEHHPNQPIDAPFTEKHGHIPYTQAYYHILGTLVARKYSLFTRKPYKVIVLDCDHTLWDGIIEEDGINGITIHDNEIRLQAFFIQCFQAGFLLCLCSKNSEASILSVFQDHPNMLLNLDQHICTYRINWESKSENIRSIAKELGLGLDSFIFVDDNKLECTEVKTHIPEVLVVHLPENKKNRLSYVQNIWAFDTNPFNPADQGRTQFYKQNPLRHKLRSSSNSYAQFLKKLKIKTTCSPAKIADFDRIVQLSQRTNQFNLAPTALNRNEYYQSISSGKPCCLTIHVSDKFGEHGLMGVVVYELSPDTLTLRTFFLSCRILLYGIEFEVINHLIDIAHQHGCTQIDIPFQITERNIPARVFLQKISGLSVLDNQQPLRLFIHDSLNKPLRLVAQYEPPSLTEVTEKKQPTADHDFMLRIAENALKNNKYRPIKSTQISEKTIKAHVIGICKRHGITLPKLNRPFIELGVSSLHAALLSSELLQIYHIEIAPLQLLSSTMTLNKLVQTILRKLLNYPPQSTSAPPPASSIESSLFTSTLSNAQKRLWYDEKISEHTHRNNLFIAYEIPNDCDIRILEKAFRTLLARHDALRFSFHAHDNEPMLTCHPYSSLSFHIQQVPLPDEQALTQYIELFHQKRFDLSEAPLLRVTVAQTADKSILLLCIHHIIHDGWSFHILCHELSILYHAYTHHIDAHLPSLSHSYSDFIAWQKHYITDKMLSTQKNYWQNFLHKLPVMELVYDKPKIKSLQILVSHRIEFNLDKVTSLRLKNLAQQHHMTLYDLLISAFGLFLSHYTGQQDISLLTAVSGRHHPQVRHIIGFFVNLLMVRFQFNSDSSLLKILKENKKTLNNIFAHQDLPMHDILQITGEMVNTHIHTFQQIGFIFQNYPSAQLTLHHTTCPRVYAKNGTSLLYDASKECRFGNLVCFMQEDESHLQGVFEYNKDLFHAKTIGHMIQAFKTLLKNISKNPNGSALDIPLISEQQKNRLFHKWNPEIVPYPKRHNIVVEFLQQVETSPLAIAITYQEQSITYSELDQRSNQLAHHLIQLGIQRENAVGIWLQRGIEHIIAMLGILKSGGCYVPLEQELTMTRIQSIVKDSNMVYMVTDNTSQDYISKDIASAPQLVYFHDPMITRAPILPVSNKITCQQLASIHYTSGTTGAVKGIMLEQSGILRLVKASNYLTISPKDRFAQTSSLLFDAAILEIWGALLNGAHLVLIDKKTLLDSSSFDHFLQEKQITMLFLTTQLFHSYAFTQPNLFRNLKYLIVGGETVLTEAVQQVFMQTNPPKFFINGYGPTENTTFSTTYTVQSTKDILNPIPIGKPISGTKVYVFGKHFNPMPIGAPGKLYVSGQGLARKYINESLNSKKFVWYKKERLFDTGDIVVWQADGQLRYLAREDNQVKINGYRIEPSEIEEQLKNHAYVEQAVVLAMPHPHIHLAAYIVLKEQHQLSEVNLHHYLKTVLPIYMLPHRYYQIDHLPITNTGKIDKKLLATYSLQPVIYTEFESSQNLLQDTLIDMYAEILQIDATLIGINSEFFDLGGSSISALRLLHKLNDHFHIKINFSILYDHATVKLLSEQISELLSKTQYAITIQYAQKPQQVLKQIKPGNSNVAPFVFLHPIGGTGFCYLELIKALPKEQPCYIIQDPSIDANQMLFDDIPSMATFYNQLLLKYLPATQFVLAGYSFGGMLALEMVGQLEKQKLAHHVLSIISFDTWVVSNITNTQTRTDLKDFVTQQYERVTQHMYAEQRQPKPWMASYYHQLQDLGMAYKPPKISKKIILFKAISRSTVFASMEHDTNFLSLYTSLPVRVYPISCDHDSILLAPQVLLIAQLVPQYLLDRIHDMA